jgi:serine/threonine protein phosphatase PrpC
MNALSFGFSENFGPQERHKFDCIQINKEQTHFALCDGANSTPWGGHAAQLAAFTLTHPLDTAASIELGIQESFVQANTLVLNKINNGAATGLSIVIKPTGIYCGSCGDSLIEVFKLSPFKGWSWANSSKLDFLPDNRSPSQLIGSTAFHSANVFSLPPKGTYVILMMSDGVHGFTSQNERLHIIAKIKRADPSNQDMQFISEELCQLAIKNNSHDDASALSMWIKFN